MRGLVSRPVFGAMGGGGGHTSGVWPAVRNISKCLYCGIGRCDWPMGGGGHRRVRGVDDEPDRQAICSNHASDLPVGTSRPNVGASVCRHHSQ
jgi:hypothetical protein